MSVALGIDPSLTRTGFALVRWERGEAPTLVFAKATTTKARAKRADRLLHLCSNAENYAEEADAQGINHPSARIVAAYEQGVFYGRKSARGMLAVAEARGACLIGCAVIGLPCVEVAPASLKKAVTGKGNATKAEVRAAVARIFGLAKPLREDESDAAAVALAALGFAVEPAAKQPRAKTRAKKEAKR